MTSTGLQRRRVTAAPDNEDDVLVATSSNGTLVVGQSGSTAVTPGHRGVHAGSAFKDGDRVAIDPRDLEQVEDEDDVGGRMPFLTLMEEVLLLGLKDNQGYLSFWNDNISYALRGCILIELALRRRIAVINDHSRRRRQLSECLVEVLNSKPTGETLLDEALRLIISTSGVASSSGTNPPSSTSSTAKSKETPNEHLSVNTWIDLLSGETWDVFKIGYQLKQVRERLAKGLVDKGVLRTARRTFFLFDMATHPIADTQTKDALVARCIALLSSRTRRPHARALGPEGEQCRALRIVCLVAAARAANVLDGVCVRMTNEEREAAFSRAEEILTEFATWPFNSNSSLGTSSSATSRIREGGRIGMGSSSRASEPSRECVLGLIDAVREELHTEGRGVGDGDDLCLEVVGAVLDILSRLDSIL